MFGYCIVVSLTALVLFVIKHFTKYTLCCRTHLTTLSHLLAVGGVTNIVSAITCLPIYRSFCTALCQICFICVGSINPGLWIGLGLLLDGGGYYLWGGSCPGGVIVLGAVYPRFVPLCWHFTIGPPDATMKHVSSSIV